MRQKLRRGRIPGDRDRRDLEACTTRVPHRRDAVRVIREAQASYSLRLYIAPLYEDYPIDAPPRKPLVILGILL